MTDDEIDAIEKRVTLAREQAHTRGVFSRKENTFFACSWKVPQCMGRVHGGGCSCATRAQQLGPLWQEDAEALIAEVRRLREATR